MGLIASLHRVARSDVAPLVAAANPRRRLLRRAPDTFEPALEDLGEELGDLGAPGDAVIVLLEHLEGLGAPVMQGELGDEAQAITDGWGLACFFTAAHRAVLAGVDPAALSPARLRQAYEASAGVEAPEAGAWMREALDDLRRHLDALPADAVLLLTVS